MSALQTNKQDVQPLIETELTIAEVAEKLDISFKAASALVAASLKSIQAGDQKRTPL